MQKLSRGSGAALTIAGFALGLGIGIAGYEVAGGLRDFRGSDRYVTVKGLSERAVVADAATWTIAFNTTASDFEALKREVESGVAAIDAFARAQGIAPDALTVEQTTVTDHHSNPYVAQHGGPRYAARGAVAIRTTEVDKVARAAREVNKLFEQGLLLEPTRPIYTFTALNDIKPQMLAEATANAKLAAQEFAKASDATVGDIRKASQGVFSISGGGDIDGGDEGYSPGAYSRDKTVRVVTTVEFSLR